MRVRSLCVVASLLAAAAGLTVALMVASASMASQTVTLGSTSGTPSANICFAACTYVPFTNVSNPGLQVPFDGNVTTFSINAGSSGGSVELRVLRPAGAGQYTGTGTSPSETLSIGVNTFPVSFPVKAGDVLGLDNDSSALMFDTSDTTPFTAYYEPNLADGGTAVPTQIQPGARLLLSATVEATTTATKGTGTGTTPTTTPAGTPGLLTAVTQSRWLWRLGSGLAVFSSASGPPVGTTFSFVLNAQASVRFSFTQRVSGRRVGGRCVARTQRNRRQRACARTVVSGGLAFGGHPGPNKVAFQGRLSRSKKLAPGPYTLTVTATGQANQRSQPASLAFTIVK
jgi:hypothetical protein